MLTVIEQNVYAGTQDHYSIREGGSSLESWKVHGKTYILYLIYLSGII